MSSNSIFSSVESEKRWVLEMHKNFPQQHTIDISFDTPTSVFRVPKNLCETKPEAYAPQYLGLGPFHHLRPDIYSTQKQKLAAVREYLDPEKLQSVQKVVDALVHFEPVLRACYDNYLDLDIKTLAWILAVDGLYLLQFMENYSHSEMEKLAGDVLMLENQIPVILLKKIQQVLQLAQVVFGGNDYLFEKFNDFCRVHSPLQLNEQFVVKGDTNQLHLLHRMYYLIVNNRGIKDKKATRISVYSMPISFGDVNKAVGFLAERGMPGASTAGQILSFMENVPWARILGLFGKNSSDEANVLVEEIDVPSVSQMTEIAGIKFSLTRGGIRDIRFDDSEGEKKFYLPIITLNSTSEIVLRNLVAFEAVFAKPGTALELAEYVDLMCGIVDTPKDVNILRMENIIESELSDEEIARIFNGIGKSKRKTDKKSNIEDAIDDVNKRYDNLGRVKVRRFLEKYVYASFKILCVLVTIAVFVLLVLNAFCSVFGCGRWFSKSTVTQSRNLIWDQ